MLWASHLAWDPDMGKMGSKLNTNKAHTFGGVCCNVQIAGVYAMQPPLWVFYSRTKFSFCLQESRIEQHLRKRTRKQTEVFTEEIHRGLH